VGHRSEGIGVAQSVAPTAPGGETGAVAAARLGGGGSSAWPRWLAGGSSGRRVGGHEWQLWARPGLRVGNFHLIYDTRMCAIID
jgi:hypothetical protein